MILRVTEKSKCSNCTSIVVVYIASDPGNPSLLRHGKGIEANAPIIDSKQTKRCSIHIRKGEYSA